MLPYGFKVRCPRGRLRAGLLRPGFAPKAQLRYTGARLMIQRLVRFAVVLLALYAFAFVPLGQKTAWEHVLAIARTPEAKDAASEIKGSAERLVGELRSAAEGATEQVGSRLGGGEAAEP